MVFALLFAQRGSLAPELIQAHYTKMNSIIEREGHTALVMPAALTRNGAVETLDEARSYAKFLRDNEDVIDGVIVAAMNFTEESATMIALRDCKVPILLNALSDQMGKLDFYNNRAAFCGRFALMATFKQFQIPYTAYTPHVCQPDSEAFAQNLRDFAGVCRVVKGMKNLRLGTIGARPQSFKTVRTDEVTLQRHGITMETFDLSEVLYRVSLMHSSDQKLKDKKESLMQYADFSTLPEEYFDNFSRWSLAVDDIISEFQLDAVALRCWNEPMQMKGISVCQIVAELNARGIGASCEVDAMNAVAAKAFSLASGNPASMVDWNYNYYEDQPNKAIMAHCGNIPVSYMVGDRQKINQHNHKNMGLGCPTWGACNGIIRPMDITFGSARTENGKIHFYCGNGKFTNDEIPGTFYRCGGVVEVPNLQNNLLKTGKAGFRHHVVFTEGNVKETLKEAFENYLGYDLMLWD